MEDTMISAFRTGQVAGSAVCREYSQHTLEEQQQAAFGALEQRKQLGVAHWIPEEEFLQGFLYGYQHPTLAVDGLQILIAPHPL
jgi:hypothetical protein